MLKTFLLFAPIVSALFSFGQKKTYELVTYMEPRSWIKEVKPNTFTSYTITNQQTKGYCRISIMLSTAGKGGIGADFESEWQVLMAKQYAITDTPKTTEPATINGWQVKSGMAPFTFNNGTSTAMLTTYSGYNKAVSIVAITNSESYIPAIQQFLLSVEMKKPATNTTTNTTVTNNTATQTIARGNFAFTTTNFDDGWVSTAKEDWVEAVKANVKVLIHYPNNAVDKYNSDLLEGLKKAWNVYVAPKYSNGTNMVFKPIYNWESIEFAEADMVEKSSGKTVHVVFFKKNFSGGSGRFLEFITPDKAGFETAFGVYDPSAFAPVWDKVAAMVNYNKFAVAASDLQGKWTNNFSGMTQYVNAYTGASAGANTHASNESFDFAPGSNYKWDLGVANGFVGNIKFQSVKSAGRFTMPNNWQLSFSDIEGKPKTYNVQFTCIKGARVLWIGSTGFGKKQP